MCMTHYRSGQGQKLLRAQQVNSGSLSAAGPRIDFGCRLQNRNSREGEFKRRVVMPRGGSAPPWRQKSSAKSEEASSSSTVPPWRQPKKPQEITHSNLKMRATNDAGGKGKMMYVPPAGIGLRSNAEKDSLFELDPQLKMAFKRNFQFIRRVFSFDTLFKPLPPVLANTLARNFGFLTRIFTQFFDPRGIQNVRRSIGLGQEEGTRRVK